MLRNCPQREKGSHHTVSSPVSRRESWTQGILPAQESQPQLLRDSVSRGGRSLLQGQTRKHLEEVCLLLTVVARVPSPIPL